MLNCLEVTDPTLALQVELHYIVIGMIMMGVV